VHKTSKPDPQLPEQPVPPPAPALPGDPVVQPEDPVELPTHPHDPLEPDPVNPQPIKVPTDHPAPS